MSNTTFVDQTTVVQADWLNDVNDTVYDILGNGTTVPTTKAAARTNLGATTVGDAVFTAANALAARTTLDVYSKAESYTLAPFRNYIDNPIGPAGVVYQRTVAAVADGAYFADRYYSLSQTGTVTPSIITAPETGFKQGVRITQSQASAQRFGFAQILPEDYVTELAGGNVSMSLRVRISNSTTLRFALLAWTGTADVNTRDVVNDWTSATFTTGNFFITGGGSYTVIATGSQAMTANTFATLSLAGQAVGATAKNLVLFCWTDSTQALNTTLDFHDVELTKSDVLVPVINRSISEELLRCQREVYKTFPLNTAPAQNAGFVGALYAIAPALNLPVVVNVSLPVEMFFAPTVTTYNTSAANANWSANPASPVVNIPAGTSGKNINISSTAANTAAGNGYYIHVLAEAVLGV